MKRPDILELKKKAIGIRKDILKMLTEAGSGHTGGSLSLVEILLALYYYRLKHDPKRPDWKGRDRLLLSKGHGCPALYAVLADRGYFPKDKLWTLRKLGSQLQGHPQLGLPGIEISSGSLGQGLSIANGIALASRLDRSTSSRSSPEPVESFDTSTNSVSSRAKSRDDKSSGFDPEQGRRVEGLDKKDFKVYCLMGDGETNEGQVWEAAMTASHYKLDNVCAIIDFNKLQIDGFCCDIKDMGPYTRKWKDFGWNPIEADGHDIEKMMDALDGADKRRGKPTVIIAHTVKGKGVSFVENKVEWHGIAPKKEEYERAIRELDEALKLLENPH